MMKGWRLVFLLYLILLFISFVFELQIDKEKPLLSRHSDSLTSGQVILFLGDLNSEVNQKELLGALFDHFKVYTVNFKHFKPDSNIYSARAQAEAILKELEVAGIDSVHIVAEGFGSVIATWLINQKKLSTRSLILNDPGGIIEYELLGGYQLNKGVYGAASITAWVLENFTPDFGAVANSGFGYKIFRAHLDTDKRLLRNELRKLEISTLINNFSNSTKNQLNAAIEIHRLIAYSNYQKFDNNEAYLASNIEFLLTPSQAQKTTVLAKIKSLLPFSNSRIIEAEGWLLIGLMLLIIFSTFISEDLACIGAGLMAARGLLGFLPAVTASFLGIFIGDILIYLAGRWLGENAAHKAPIKWFMNEKDIERSNEWFKVKGPVIILISRFIPGTRFPTYFSAGVIGASFTMFIAYFGIASLLWTPMLVSAAMFLGKELIYYFSIYQEYALLVLIVVVFLAFMVLKVVIPLFTFKGRRLLYGKFQRFMKWEFWPPKILYIPVVFYSLYLWVRFKKITVVTAANPAIEEGGFIGESKYNILEQFKSREFLPRFYLIDSKKSYKELASEAERFMERFSLEFPIVLKPDKGERGKGVQIIRSQNQLINGLTNINEHHILQEFVPGEEYGIFYYRYPNQVKGQIFSITKKEGIVVTGDGKHTLEQLILKDPRAVYMAQVHFDKHAHDLFEIPESGKKIELVELGTHSRGSLFLDGSHLITKALVEKMDRISKRFEGFYFGRYDIKVPSEEALRKGEDIKVLEVNGVTSESTNIYDPKHGLLFAVKTLLRQWKIAFEIGAVNYKNGAEIPSFSYMMKLIFSK